ncbi:MAG: hypothetical protein BWK78_02530 [Thiotrichaceae bacterium IS1]|nr:MAG: hypothetical protein BWK78_02530 [Thiotrichaceae bacterium IS1]
MKKITAIILFIVTVLIENGCQSINKEKPSDNGFSSLKNTINEFEKGGSNHLNTGLPPNDIFEKLKGTLALALFMGKSGEPFTEKEIVSMYFDSFRLLNKFIEFDLTDVPQQQKSPIRLTVLESLTEGLKPNIPYVEDGYAIFDRKAMEENQKATEENRKADGRNQQEEGDTPHDILVMCPVTRGIKEINENVEGGKPLYAGYLRGIEGDDNIDIARFTPTLPFSSFVSNTGSSEKKQTISDDSLTIDRLKLSDSLFPALLHVIAPKNDRNSIVSLSYAFDKIELQKIKENKDADKNVLGQLESLSEKHIIVSTLWNKTKCPGVSEEDAKYCEGIQNGNLMDRYDAELDFIEPLDFLKKTLKNLILVSTVTLQYDFSTGRFSDYSEEFSKREGLKKAGIEFFSILGDYTVSPIKNKQLDLSYMERPANSFATPLLSAIIFNLMSINPMLSSSQVKDILKKSALNNPDAQKIMSSQILADPTLVGYIVNPDEAYKFAIGSLVANAQRERYDCKSSRISLLRDKEEWKWIVQCNNEKANQSTQAEDYNHGVDMSGFYANAKIYSSRLHTEGVSQVSEKKGLNTVIPNNPEKVIISGLKMEYRKKDIMVEFAKEFCSPGYSDTTTKRMFIDYSERTETGIPRLDEELVLKTVATAGCN